MTEYRGIPFADGYGEQDTRRLHDERSTGDERSPFARDLDRLIYTPAFRRLQAKTQVAPAGEAEFFRTRLTHTLEVAQVARRLTESVNRRAVAARDAAGTPQWIEEPDEVRLLPAAEQKLDPDLVEAAAVLHDLGHPPFAHVGEKALGDGVTKAGVEWQLPETGGFNGNAQSFRLVTRILSHHPPARGLQLTYAVLDAALKYPWIAGSRQAIEHHAWSVNPTESVEFEELRAGIPPELTGELTIEAQVMDWADDVAYSVHDLDDWNRAGYMPLARLAIDGNEQARFVEFVTSRRPEEDSDELRRRVLDLLGDKYGPFAEFRVAYDAHDPIFDATSGAARRAIRRLRGNVFGDAMSRFTVRKRADPVLQVPRGYVFAFEPEEDVRFKVSVLKDLLWMYVIDDARMATQQHGHRRVITELFDIFQKAALADQLRLFPLDRRRYMEKPLEPIERLRSVVDYISNLTDADALRLHERLRSGGTGLHHYA
jgi:dGTPase